MRTRSSRILRDLVVQRIKILYDEAENAVRRGEKHYAKTLTNLIRRLSQRNRVRIPRRIKRGICKKCGIPLIPGLTARVRLRRQGKTTYIVVTCLECGWIHRRAVDKHGFRKEGSKHRASEEA